MYIVKAIQRIETISLPSTYENFSSLFLQIKLLLLLPKWVQVDAKMSKSYKHKIIFSEGMLKVTKFQIPS